MAGDRRNRPPPYALGPNRADSGWVDELRHRLRRFFVHPATELVIGVLILISVSLTLVELSLPVTADSFNTVANINYVLTVVFAIELTLRYVAESGGEHAFRRFFKKWWIDIIAVFPSLILFGPFRLFRGLRVLRYFRLLRIGRVFTGAGNLLPYVLRRGAAHLGLIMLALFVTVVVGTSLILSFEQASNPEISGFAEAFWFSLLTLFAGEPIPGPLQTTEGRVASVVVMFMGVSVFAAFTGTVSAFMIDRMQREGRPLEKGRAMEDHIVLCGLGTVGFRILQVLLKLEQRVLVIEKNGDSEFVDWARTAKVPVIVDDVRKRTVLENAGTARARAVMAVTDDDLTNLEVALDARSIRPDIRVVLRLFDERLAQKVHEGFNIQVAFSSSALAAPSFAAAAIDRSVQGSLEIGDRVFIQSEFVIPTASALAGRKVGDVYREYGIHTMVARGGQDGDYWAPSHSYRLRGGSQVVLVGPFDEIEELKRNCHLTEDLVRAVSGNGDGQRSR